MTTTKNGAVGLAFDEAKGIATLTLQMEGAVNKIDEHLGEGLLEAVGWAKEKKGLKGIIIATAHKDFCVGADIDMLYAARDAKQMYERVRALQTGFRELETMGVPVVAALTGSALGGGYELALSCHRRIAVDSPKIQFGLPEVTLGVIPGGGGTQRLPRMIGFQGAADIILQGKMLRAAKAKAAGLVDELCPDADAVRAAAEKWIAENPGAKQPWDQSGFKWPHPAPGTTDSRDMLLAGCGMLFKKTAGAYRAPEVAINAMQDGCILKIDRGMEVEARYFAKLAVSDQAKDMIRTLWFHRTAAEKHEGLPSTDDDGFEKVGILGAGMMGGALAWVTANAGYDVVLKDIRQEALDAANEHCQKLTAKRAKHLDDAGKKALLGRIKTTLELQDLKGCDLIIEAVFEDLGLKHTVEKETEPLLAENAVWASNTSALPITELAKASKQPERFIGLHFFSPVEQMPLLEIIMGERTDEQTLARCLAYCRKIKKTPIVVNDGYAFYTTRVFSAYLMEAVQLVAEGHDPALIEWAARSAGMVVGPLQVFDEVTLTLVRKAMPQAEKYRGEKIDHAGFDLLVKVVDQHERYGKAAGAGFYDYVDGRRQGIWPGLKELATGTPAETGVELLGKRLLLAQCLEAARALEAGVLQRKRDAEVGAIFGLGFAPNSGGPLSFMDRFGITNVVAELQKLADQYGKHYAPPKLLVDMAAKGERFFDEV
ncbi:MAG: enoyl-CoA hydratase/isomerase family protein [Deltaproteobacteria bacterium]|jgi:3-hydroxyacyl-CoA dehydrogenase/enoyl-CoA hydratase/3-hydroxybutyryl-CoA epimerase|nr:enoyl-CoA hydratase/isomerase family protein [Deltaproteobacteria bacterium]MBW2532438.1 enoyl-CoA hydratase/isomerase family protein [Deltaproteobacteria bacterium]